MAPREPIGDGPMSSAERVKRARWVNRLEDTVFKLIDLIDDAPVPLPRKPEIPFEIIEKLKPFLDVEGSPKKDVSNVGQIVRFLKLGNGNQVNNKKKAMKYIVGYFNAEQLDNKTIRSEEWGNCHVSAYTHEAGAMISTPNRDDQNYGGAPWHSNDHIILFRDVGDGRCKIYVSKIEPLFRLRTIGHHGVKWGDVEELASSIEVIETQKIIDELEIGNA